MARSALSTNFVVATNEFRGNGAPGADRVPQPRGVVQMAGPALASESPYRAPIARRRLRRLRRIDVHAQRDDYWRQRATLEAQWRERAERHADFRATMRSVELPFRVLRRLGAFD